MPKLSWGNVAPVIATPITFLYGKMETFRFLKKVDAQGNRVTMDITDPILLTAIYNLAVQYGLLYASLWQEGKIDARHLKLMGLPAYDTVKADKADTINYVNEYENYLSGNSYEIDDFVKSNGN